MRKRFIRSKNSIVKDYGHIPLTAACVRANQTGFFALGERVAPESFDGNDTNINVKNVFFGGRRVELAVHLQDATEIADRGTSATGDTGEGTGTNGNTSEGS